jgi:hypothetical protein
MEGEYAVSRGMHLSPAETPGAQPMIPAKRQRGTVQLQG